MSTNPSRSTGLPRLRRIALTLLTLLAIAVALPLAGQASESRTLERTPNDGQAAGGRLVGTWEFQVGFVNCETGAPLAPSFRSLHVYIPGGSMIEQGGAVGPPPTASRSVGQGIWERQSPGIFKSLFKFFTFDATGQNLARLEVEELVEFQSRDQLDVHAVVAVFAPSGVQVGTNCLVGSGTRLGFPE